MNDRPTPETNAFSGNLGDWIKFAEKLERERDEARAWAERLQRNACQHSIRAENAERERDEAREKLEDWENAAAHVEADHPDEVHCGCVPVLRKLLTDARQERDKARSQRNALAASLEYIASAGISARHCEDEAKKMLALVFEKEALK